MLTTLHRQLAQKSSLHAQNGKVKLKVSITPVQRQPKYSKCAYTHMCTHIDMYPHSTFMLSSCYSHYVCTCEYSYMHASILNLICRELTMYLLQYWHLI